MDIVQEDIHPLGNLRFRHAAVSELHPFLQIEFTGVIGERDA